jgi:hypothetical protein
MIEAKSQEDEMPERPEERRGGDTANIESASPNEELQTINHQLQTEEMEVHHHPHVEKKNFKEYFLEFLMIFLAVTMGFFAENLREHINNNEHVKNNMKSLMADLKSDSAMFSEVVKENLYAEKMIDTLIDMLNEQSPRTGHIYFLARNITAVIDNPRPNTRTFDQMKTEGSFHLIDNKNLLDSITLYYQALKFFEMGSNIELQKLYDVHSANSELFNGVVLKKIFTNQYINSEKNALKVVEPGYDPPLMSKDPVLINKIIVRYGYLASVLKENDGEISVETVRYKQLIKLLKSEYDL